MNPMTMSFRRECVVPGVSRRDDFTLHPQRCALLVIDIQQYLCPGADRVGDGNATDAPIHPESGAGTPCVGEKTTKNDPKVYYSDYYNERIQSVVFNIKLLAQAFREIRDQVKDRRSVISSPPSPEDIRPSCSTPSTGCEVIFTYLQAATNDRRDISLDYKLSGPLLSNIPTIATPHHELFVPTCAPSFQGKGDICLPKTSCNVFASTNLDYLLRQLNVDQLVVVGQMTEQCVESAVRHAADLGFYVCVPSDACITTSAEAHDRGLLGMHGFARMVESTEQILHELTQATTTSASVVAAVSRPITDRETVLPAASATRRDDLLLLQALGAKLPNDSL